MALSQERREQLVRELYRAYAAISERLIGNLGVADVTRTMHKLLDEIATEVYEMPFAYCGREHSVI